MQPPQLWVVRDPKQGDTWPCKCPLTDVPYTITTNTTWNKELAYTPNGSDSTIWDSVWLGCTIPCSLKRKCTAMLLKLRRRYKNICLAALRYQQTVGGRPPRYAPAQACKWWHDIHLVRIWIGHHYCMSMLACQYNQLKRPGDIDLWPFDLESGVRVTCDVRGLPLCQF